MGVSLDQWRASIGCFAGGKLTAPSSHPAEVSVNRRTLFPHNICHLILCYITYVLWNTAEMLLTVAASFFRSCELSLVPACMDFWRDFIVSCSLGHGPAKPDPILSQIGPYRFFKMCGVPKCEAFLKTMALELLVVISVLLFIGGIEMNPGPFPCTKCSLIPETIASNIRHQKFHSLQRNFEYYCPAESCIYFTTSFGALKYHVSISHRGESHHDPSAPQKIVCTHMMGNMTKCSFSTTSLWSFIQHLYEHLDAGILVECPITGCTFDRNFQKKSTFRVHLSQYHKNWRAEGCPKERFQVNIDADVPNIDADVPNIDREEMDIECDDQDDDLCFDEESDESFNSDLLNDELIYDAFAKFYLNLYADDLLPASLIQKICVDIAFLSDIVHGRLALTLSSELKKLGLEEDKVKHICHTMQLADPLFVTHHKGASGPSLTSNHLREKYFQENFGYIRPKEINLNEDDVTSDQKYQYIKPTRTLQKLVEDPSVQEEIDASFSRFYDENSNIISDYYTGSQFQSENHPPNELQLFVYQDAVNAVMNPLGSAKNKFKMLVMYFTIGNYEPPVRAKVETKYAVLMIRESVCKEVGVERTFGEAVAEFLHLEKNGIMYKGRHLKVAVQFLLGDNLGQHMIGGFVQSFSGRYFCRFCPIQMAEFKANPDQTEPLRTVEEYSRCLLKAELTGKPCKGIKEGSAFNSLKYFHVTRHLVPCLAHDLFEGVVSWDMAGIITHLVKKKKYFSLKLLNRRIKDFICVSGDAPNKPAYVGKKLEKLGGHAVQNWTMLRIFPFIIGDKIIDSKDPGWQLYLQLKELVEYFCAPALKKDDIPFIKDVLLPAYFERRASVLNQIKYPLKPKHHFMAHYPELILKYGVLINFWTLSYEQKHKFFKLVMRMMKCYINPEFTCAVRYMLKFCSMTCSNMLQKGCQEFESKVFSPSNFDGDLYQFLEELNLEGNWRYSKKVCYNGLTFKTDDLILLSTTGNGVVQAGFIKVIATKGTLLFFVLESIEGHKCEDKGVHCLPLHSSGQYIWKSISDLQYPVCQPVYIFEGRQGFSLKYHIISDVNSNIA